MKKKPGISGAFIGTAFAHVEVWQSEGDGRLSLLNRFATEEALRGFLRNLPADCVCLHVHLLLRGQIVGNAIYQIYLSETGMNDYLYVHGACVGWYRLFSDLYSYRDVAGNPGQSTYGFDASEG